MCPQLKLCISKYILLFKPASPYRVLYFYEFAEFGGLAILGPSPVVSPVESADMKSRPSLSTGSPPEDSSHLGWKMQFLWEMELEGTEG